MLQFVNFTSVLQEGWKWRKPCRSKGVLYFEENRTFTQHTVYINLPITTKHTASSVLVFTKLQTLKNSTRRHLIPLWSKIHALIENIF